MDNKLTQDIKTSADFANVMQYKAEQQRLAIYDSMKDKLSDFIKSSSDFANVLQYLSPSQRTAVFEVIKGRILDLIQSDDDKTFTLRYLPDTENNTVKNLLRFIERMNASPHAKQFVSALLKNNDEEMKSQFDTLLRKSFPPIMNHHSFFKKQNNSSQLIDATAQLGPQWIGKLNQALGLNLTDEHVSSSPDVKAALQSYLISSQLNRSMNL